MCGRYTLHHSTAQIKKRFDLQQVIFEPKPRYNIAPTQTAAIITQRGDKRVLEGYQWGLIPSWAKDDKIAYKTINARVETVAEKPSFRGAFKSGRRCIVVADGFYEWPGEGKEKHPVHFRFKDEGLMAFAGLWEEWQSPSGPLRTFTIITALPNELVKDYHDRSPVILKQEDEEAWLDPEISPDHALSLLNPYADYESMEVFPVSKEVGNVKNDDSYLIEPQDMPS